MASYLSIVFLAAAFVCVGCGDKNKYGKFNEEQMSQIGLANKYDLPAPTGNSMVMGVHSDTISSEEILTLVQGTLKPVAARMDDKDTFIDWARPHIRNVIRGKMIDILLYEKARRTAPEKIDEMLEKAADSEINRFVSSYGNNYALAESKIREMGMDWRSFREFQKKMIMTRSYLSGTLKDQMRFSQQELRDYYEKHKQELFCKKGDVGFSLIAVYPEKLTPEQIADDPSAEAAAKRIATQLKQELADGADFAELAKQYHGDLAAVGGKVLPFEPGKNALPEPYRSLEAYAVQMQPEQTEGPIEIGGHLFIVKLDTLQIAGCKSFEEARPLIEEQLLFQYNQDQYDKLVNKLMLNTDLAELERFTDFCVNQAYRRWSRSGT